MKAVVKAGCLFGGYDTNGNDLKIFDGLQDDTCFSEYFGDWNNSSSLKDLVSGGYMSFKYNHELKILYTITIYDVTRKLSSQEETILIRYTQGQWSDGIGESYEQVDRSDELEIKHDNVYRSSFYFNDEDDYLEDNHGTYLSPWYSGQTAWIYYDEENN